MENIVVTLDANIAAFKAGMDAADKQLQQFQGNLKRFEDTTGSTASNMTKLGMKFKQFAQSFKMWGLSIMFMGMLIMRTFERLAKTAVSTFTKIIESNGYAGTAIQQVGAAFTYLGFVVGSVINRFLTPLLPIIMRVVNTIANWTQQHPKLTTAIIFGSIALGLFMFFLGQMILLIPALTALLAALGGVFSGIWKVGLLAIKGVITLFEYLAANPIILVITAIVVLIVMILNLKKICGSWGDFFKSVLGGLLIAITAVGEGIVRFIVGGINLAIKAVNLLVKGYNALATTLGLTKLKSLELLVVTGGLKELEKDMKASATAGGFWAMPATTTGINEEDFTLKGLLSPGGALAGLLGGGGQPSQVNNITVNTTTNATADEIARAITNSIKAHGG